MSCGEVDKKSIDGEKTTLFTMLDSAQTGIDFENTLSYTNDFNIYKYRNYYNGGGVALGDVNNDGFLDIYFTANLLPNRLYLNNGDFTFTDATDKAGVGGTKAWSTGAAMVDVNADGWLDIYVCNSGDVRGDNKQNEFFINNGDGTFKEEAQEMGLADSGYSTHANFFDYDKDGDLDVYLLNNSYRSVNSFNLKINEREVRDELGGDKLLRNDGTVFTDVSEEAGIYGSEIGFGLGVAVGDLDKDGWMDIYVCNDFFERDYIYMNNGDGTFREELERQMQSISVASMGSDIADITGDGLPEIFVTEMLPEPDDRFKTTMTFENWDKYQNNLKYGYYHQFTRNMLHRNNGIFPDKGLTFSELGRMAGVEATDWSWSALITDFDADGHKDLFIANGLAQDILNQDYLNYVANEEVAKMVVKEEGVDYKQLIDIIPINPIPNYIYGGTENIEFKDKTEAWGLQTPSHSNGAAYGDMDNDGDLDLLVNNANMPPFVYRNNSDKASNKNNSLQLTLQGGEKNRLAVGTKVTVKANGKLFYLEQAPNRGFQSSVDPRLHFGLGTIKKVDTLIVEWPYGKRTVMTGLEVNQMLTLKEEEAALVSENESSLSRTSLFKDVSDVINLDYKHAENSFVDFNRDRLLYHMKSNEGPKLAVADVNDDGLDDFFVGGAKDAKGGLYLQKPDGSYKSTNDAVFETDAGSEDISCLFFDSDGDGDMDLYVASGGSEFSSNSFGLMDRLYFNDGKGNFKKSDQLLPAGKPESSSVVVASDYDKDGDQDIFVGIRLKSGLIGVPQNGYILINDGQGNFSNETNSVAPELLNLGMITDAVWADYDNDGDDDLLTVGEWMAIRIFNNVDGKLTEVSTAAGLTDTSGWWNAIEAADLDDDGDIDFIVGNHGLNSRFRASKEEPISCYINDFDQNGMAEQIICMYNEGVSYPQPLRHDLVMQLPKLKKKYLEYESYKNQTIQDMFPEEILKSSVVHEVTQLRSVLLNNRGDGTFEVMALPLEAQSTPIYAITIEDFDGDGKKDIFLGGNLYKVKPEVGRYDASYGVLLSGKGNLDFEVVTIQDSGLFIDGEVRDAKSVKIGNKKVLMVAKNNLPIQLFEF